MKKLILMFTLFISCNIIAQEVKRDSNGHFYVVSASKVLFIDSVTKYKYTHSDRKLYPVFVSKNGKYYSWIISKKGNRYKKYHITKS